MNGKRKLFISLLTSAALLLTTAGCASEGGNNVSSGSTGGSSGSSGGNGRVAFIEQPPEGAGNRFDIFYDEWYSEYLFNMSRGGYTEESDPDVAESYKQSIVDYQVQERIVLYLAEQQGISAETLTEEELAKIEENVQSSWDDWCESYETEAIEALGDTYTEEQLYQKEFELFSAFMEESRLKPEIFYVWETNSLIQDKFIEKVSDSLDDKTVADFVQETIDTAKDYYENDLAIFEQSYTPFYVPEGTRLIQQIQVLIDDDAANEIRAYRNDGDNQKADQLLEEALAPVQGVIDEAYEKLLNGTAWSEVQEEYNQDSNGNDVDYVVYPTSTYISQQITDSAMSIAEKGGFSEIIINDVGFFILYYKDDRVFSDEEMQSLLEQARDYLKDQESYKQVTDFKEQYPYIYDYELMGLSTFATE